MSVTSETGHDRSSIPRSVNMGSKLKLATQDTNGYCQTKIFG